MSIQQAYNDVDNTSSTLDLREYALALHALGFTVIPVHDHSKIAAVEWKKYQIQPQTSREVASFQWSQNIAALSGPNGFLNFDLDECTDPEHAFTVLEMLGLSHEYPWTMHTPGRGGGFHAAWVRCLEPLPFSKGVTRGYPLIPDAFDHVELRTHDCYTMLPPSIHPDTLTPYSHAFADPQMVERTLFSREITPIAIVPAKLIEAAFYAIAKREKEIENITIIDMGANTLIQEQGTPQIATTTKERKKDAWAQKALNQELELLQQVVEGLRNTQLNKSSFNLGQIIGSKLLDREEVETVLARTASMIGLTETEISATMKSGIESGLKKPRLPKQVFRSNEPPVRLPKLTNIDEEKLASFTADDQGNAEAVFYLYGQYIAYNEAYGWLVWNGTHFSPSQQRINTLIVETLRLRMQAARHLERTELAVVSKGMAGRIAACRSLLENIAFVEVSEFDNEPDLINVTNGIVDLRTKTVFPHSPEYRFTWCSPIRYLSEADRSIWLKFLEETLDTPEMIDYLQQALGYSITGHTSEECLFYVFGPPRSGKGSMTECILCIFPRPITLEVDFNTFTAKREGDNQNFDLAPLKAARIVFASESNKYQSLNPAKVKALTGGNLVHCAFKHKDFFNYRPQYAVWLSSNHEVNGDADDDALWGRIRVIHFPHSRLGSEDKTLKMRLQSTEVLEGVLSFLVDGAYQWYQNQGQGLVTPESVKQVTQKQRDSQDSVGQWLEECCKISEGDWIENSLVRISYENWCEANGYEPKKAKGLAQSLAAHGLEVSVSKWTSAMKVMRGVKNLVIL